MSSRVMGVSICTFNYGPKRVVLRETISEKLFFGEFNVVIADIYPRMEFPPYCSMVSLLLIR